MLRVVRGVKGAQTRIAADRLDGHHESWRFFVELGRRLSSRRVHMVWCTPNPSAPCVFQQGRQLSWTVPERAEPVKFLIRDREVASRESAPVKDVWTISGQFFAEQHAIPGSHPSYRHEEPASPTTCVTLLTGGLLVRIQPEEPIFRNKITHFGP